VDNAACLRFLCPLRNAAACRTIRTVVATFIVYDELDRCPYLAGHVARLPLRVPARPLTRAEVDAALAAGDRRQGVFLYRPSCPACQACEAIRIPVGRTQIDWECELGVVVGKTASRVNVSDARSHVFGYTLELDVSDRGGRGDTRHGSDWLVGKSHDTFAPLGPFIVPKEFVRDVQKLGIKFTLNGTVMQDADTSLMIHNVDELVAFGSSILTLRPGDVIATGSPAGVGSARTPPIFLKPGDKTVCTYEGVGTLTNTVTSAK